MTGFHYMAGWADQDCERCTERLTLEVEYLGGGPQPCWAVVREFCWACNDPVPFDWDLEHEEAFLQAGIVLSAQPPTKGVSDHGH